MFSTVSKKQMIPFPTKNLMWVTVLLLNLSFLNNNLSAQAITSNYYPVAYYTDTITGGSFTQVIGPGAYNTVSTLQTFGGGFTFNFAGTVYSTFSISTSGWVKLGSIGGQYFNPNLSNPNTWPIIAPYLSYLVTAPSIGSVGYQISGAAPNRTCVIQWKNVYNPGYMNTPVTFEARLYESTGKIAFVYGSAGSNSYNYATGIGTTFNSINSYASISMGVPASTSAVQYSINSVSNNPITGGTAFKFTPDSIPSAMPINGFSSAGLTCITLAWEDSSATEKIYEVWRSADSINYSILSIVYSKSETSLGNVYNFSDDGLSPNTTYYYRICSKNFGATPVDSLTISDSTQAQSLWGLKHIPGDYPSLGTAFLDINCKGLTGAIIVELDTLYNPVIETYPWYLPSATATTVVNTITIRPDSGSGPINFVVNTNHPLLDFNSTSNLIIDGRADGVGNIALITFTNNSTSQPTIKFSNDAISNTIRYCNIYGSNNSNANGVIQFGGSAGITGNDKITFDHCDIGKGLNTPVNLLTSIGSIPQPNDSILLVNCTLHDFKNFANNVPSNAVYLGTGNRNWKIHNCSFFHSDTLVTTNGSINYVYIEDTSGYGFEIDGNYFGGTDSMCSGNRMLFTGPAAVSVVKINCADSGWSDITNNVITNISFNTTQTSMSKGIEIDGGKIRIGTYGGNVIGNTTGAFDIYSSGNEFSAIEIVVQDTVEVMNNVICGVNSANGFTGIRTWWGAGFIYIRHNTIGHGVTSSAISGSGGYNMAGIDARSHCLIDSNLIANMSLLDSTYGYNRRLGGITIHEGAIPISNLTITISNNKIYNLHSNAGDINANIAGFCVCGIYLASNDGQCRIVKNNIYNLTASTSNTQMSAHGIVLFTRGTQYVLVDGNKIHSITMPNSGTLSRVSGITCIEGKHNLINNMISLGIAADGSSAPGGAKIRGIHSYSTNQLCQNNILHNSFYIGGVNSIVGNTSTAITADDQQCSDSLFNNIICNERYDTMSPTNHHAGIVVNYSNLLRSDYNIYYAPGPNAIEVNNYPVFSNWQATGKDINSFIGNPNYLNADGDSSSWDLHLGPITPAEGSGTNISTVMLDIDDETRSAFSPTDIGADCGNFVITGNTEDNTFNNPAQAFPNPFTSSITVSTDSAYGSFEICIIDLNGQILECSKHAGASATISTDLLAPGIYILRVRTESDQITIPITRMVE